MPLCEESLQITVQWFEPGKLLVQMKSSKLKLSFSTKVLEQMSQSQCKQKNPENIEA